MMPLQNLRRRLDRLPMLRAFVPFAAGIALADSFTLPTWFVWAAFLLSGAAALFARSSVYTTAALLFFGWGLHGLHESPPDPLPYGVRTEFALIVGEHASGRITAWRNAETGQWRGANSTVVLRSDSTAKLQTGEKILFRGYLNDFPANLPSYGELMRRRGYAGSIWISERQILTRQPARGTSLHTSAVGRLARLGLPDNEQALCVAMAAGERSGLTRELRAAYARSGTAHLLAVSGLHVGIVFLLVNVLLWWLPALRWGHLLRNGAAVALIWLYAATTGFSPSVVRAALMFSALQLSLASASAYVSGNVLAATAFGMLVWNPAWLYDVSFRLSFLAVAAILAWAVPMGRMLRTRYRLLNAFTSTLAVGLAATVATTPLAAHTFGLVPVAGLAVNPVILPLAAIIVFGSVLWMAAPFAFLAPIFRFVLGTAAAWQNAVAAWAAALPGAYFEIKPSAAQTAAVYLVFAAITAAIWCAEPKKKVSLRR